jgi:hypothetical protein
MKPKYHSVMESIHWLIEATPLNEEQLKQVDDAYQVLASILGSFEPAPRMIPVIRCFPRKLTEVQTKPLD